MKIEGTIITVHPRACCIAAALRPDNLTSMETRAEGDRVVTMITGTKIGSVIASVDDYLMNLAIAEDACSQISAIKRELEVGINRITISR
jgi:hypothetical protein